MTGRRQGDEETENILRNQHPLQHHQQQLQHPQQQQQRQQQRQRQHRQQRQHHHPLVRADPRPIVHRNYNHGMNDAENPLHDGVDVSDDEYESDRQRQQQQRAYLAIEDEGQWLRRYGLRGEPHYGAESYTNQQEAKQRVRDQVEYQAQIHARLFAGQTEAEQRRQTQLAKWSDLVVRIQATSSSGDVAPIECNLRHLASHSDTVFTMAESRLHFESSSIVPSNHDDGRDASPSGPLVLSLHEYSYDAVLDFLELLRGIEDEKEGAPFPNEESIVECCQIANYLQCTALLDNVLVPILIQSVDSANCLSLCQLADQLHLPALLEASVNHMMRSLGSVEEHEIWGDLSPELQNRIQTIQQILQSSNRRQLFFSSFEEYLALFAEQIEYYRERLEDAVHQQSQHRQRSRGWEYAQSKIDQQQKRVSILTMVLQEQKKLFQPRPRAQAPIPTPQGSHGR